MKINGFLDGLTPNTFDGWVGVDLTNNTDLKSKPYITISICNDIIAEGFTNTNRPDIKISDRLIFGFSLTLKKQILEIKQLSDFSVTVKFQDVYANLEIYKPIEIVLQFYSLPNNQKHQFIKSITSQLDNYFNQLNNTFSFNPRIKTPVNKLCVITYANDATAWFPYFYQYYAKLVGESGIYVITPKPESFSSYKFGGLITYTDIVYDDFTRAEFVSALARGLQAYYKWTLVCDIDEIVIPNPQSGLDFIDLLEKLGQEEIIVSRGFDILQMPDEKDFSFNLPILEQRSFGYPNMALYKPHLAQVPIQYSIGHHYCNYKLNLPSIKECFLTLHLKFACKKIRQEVANIVEHTTYQAEKTASYSIDSISDKIFSQKLNSYLRNKIEDYNSVSMQEFEKNYSSNLEFSDITGLWIGKHITASFLIDLKALTRR